MQGENFSWNDFELTTENKKIYRMLRRCMERRNAYQERSLQTLIDLPYEKKFDSFKFTTEGVYTLLDDCEEYKFAPSIAEYYTDSDFIISLAHNGPVQSLCFRRLENLRHNFLMYKNLSSEREKIEQKQSSKCDFYKAVKVDTHVHHSACMNSKHLLKFIKNKVLHCPNDIVYMQDGIQYTLKEILIRLNITEDNLCIDALDTHAHTDTFYRFDRFNLKYNPYGQPILREIFLKYDNYIKGAYLSELTKEVFALNEESKYLYYEYRISIYGKSQNEWGVLADWIKINNLKSDHAHWLIQIPRLYSVLVETKTITSFGELLSNIFGPLFEISLDPSLNPNLAEYLCSVVGFDCVDDESLKERRYHKKFPLPHIWSHKENPPYSYYTYFLYANITSLNHLRKSRGLNTFSFRPHAGEAGEPEHLAYTFLTAQSISHGIMLRKSLPLQFLYYVCKIGLAMSPLSNNSLFLPLENHPFNEFFQKGLNVSVSTDDPLQFHFTKDPLMEEYSVVTQVWKFSSADQCELAWNSVMQSNFPDELKKEWIGINYKKEGIEANDVEKTNIPMLRFRFRYFMWLTESNLILLD